MRTTKFGAGSCRPRREPRRRRAEKLGSLLDLIVSRCDGGAQILTGEVPPPNCDELREAIAPMNEERPAVQHDRGDPLIGEAARMVEAEKIIGDVGWPKLIEACQTIKRLYPAQWKAFRLHLLMVESPYRWTANTNALETVAQLCGVSARTVIRRRHDVPRSIAWLALNGGMQEQEEAAGN